MPKTLNLIHKIAKDTALSGYLFMVPPSIQSRMHELPSIPWVRRFFVLTEKCLYMFLSAVSEEYVVDQFLFAADFHSGLTATMDLSEISFALAKSDAKGVRQSWILQALTKSSKIMWFESIKSLIDAEQNVTRPSNRFTPTDNNNSSGNSRFTPPRKSSATGFVNSEDTYHNSPSTLLDRNAQEFNANGFEVLSFDDRDPFYQVGMPHSFQSQSQQGRQIPYAKWSAAPSIVSDVTVSSSYMATKLEDAYETFRDGAKIYPFPPPSPVQHQQQMSVVAKTAKTVFTSASAATANTTKISAVAVPVVSREPSKSSRKAALSNSNSGTETASKRKGSVQVSQVSQFIQF
ncbi:hypothetical protein HK100_002985 [Physocladia obscura]|uniref:PH domain-containing protein n=1 Tax=Physocladia obscura TaxID=109957 RepID=A0AAD5T0K5_9FUNG|nr:hypothetical protein HK100_002985 [Physocladia obscura]